MVISVHCFKFSVVSTHIVLVSPSLVLTVLNSYLLIAIRTCDTATLPVYDRLFAQQKTIPTRNNGRIHSR